MNPVSIPECLPGSANLLGEPARLSILWALLDRRAYTAGELALVADLSAPSASMHLARLLEASWVSVARRGRHRYYTIADDAVAHAVEAIGAIRFTGRPRRRPPRPQPDERLQRARSCYGHLAGAVAVSFWNALLERHWMRRDGRRFALSTTGAGGLARFLQCRRDDAVLTSSLTPCMDWTERRFHLGGALGVRLFGTLRDRGWLMPVPRSRRLRFAPGRERALVQLVLDGAAR